jgi:hypothetical protein
MYPEKLAGQPDSTSYRLIKTVTKMSTENVYSDS